MTRTCPFENRSLKEFSFESLKSQTNPGETDFETLYGFKDASLIVFLAVFNPFHPFIFTQFQLLFYKLKSFLYIYAKILVPAAARLGRLRQIKNAFRRFRSLQQ